MAEVIYRAGLVPYFIDENGDVLMMFMRPSDPTFGGPHFQIAKGKLDPGENAEQAAVREAQEELGLFKGNVDGTVHLVGNFLGRTTIFTCKVKDRTMFGQPHFETGEVTWMTLEDFMAVGRTLHKPVVQAVARKIQKLEN